MSNFDKYREDFELWQIARDELSDATREKADILYAEPEEPKSSLTLCDYEQVAREVRSYAKGVQWGYRGKKGVYAKRRRRDAQASAVDKKIARMWRDLHAGARQSRAEYNEARQRWWAEVVAREAKVSVCTEQLDALRKDVRKSAAFLWDALPEMNLDTDAIVHASYNRVCCFRGTLLRRVVIDPIYSNISTGNVVLSHIDSFLGEDDSAAVEFSKHSGAAVDYASQGFTTDTEDRYDPIVLMVPIALSTRMGMESTATSDKLTLKVSDIVERPIRLYRVQPIEGV